MKIESIKLKDYKVLQNFEIDFKNSDGDILDTIVIAGINSSGKTTILEIINNLFSKEYYTDLFDDIKIFNNFSINIKGASNFILNEYEIKKILEKIIYLKVNEIPKKEIIIDQIKKFIDMIKDQNEDITVKQANQKAVNEINSIFDGLDLKTRFQGISKDIQRDILFCNDIKNDIKLDELSTGEQQLFIRALSLKMMSLKDCIILIDEPETSLHPNWQNHILRVYENIASQGSNQLIIATHSPQIISSTPNESLRLLVKEAKDIKVKTYDNSYGTEIEEVLQDIMGTKYLRTPKVARKIKQMWDAIHSGNIELFDNIYNELENILNLNDKDLTLARLEKARILSKK